MSLYCMMVCNAYFQTGGAAIKEVDNCILLFLRYHFCVDGMIVIGISTILLIYWTLYRNKPTKFIFLFVVWVVL